MIRDTCFLHILHVLLCFGSNSSTRFASLNRVCSSHSANSSVALFKTLLCICCAHPKFPPRLFCLSSLAPRLISVFQCVFGAGWRWLLAGGWVGGFRGRRGSGGFGRCCSWFFPGGWGKDERKRKRASFRGKSSPHSFLSAASQIIISAPSIPSFQIKPPPQQPQKQDVDPHSKTPMSMLPTLPPPPQKSETQPGELGSYN